MNLTRRRMLYGSSLVGTSMMAGCLESGVGASGNDDQDGDENGDGGDDGNESDDGDDENDGTGDADEKNDDGESDEGDDGDDGGESEYVLADYETLFYTVNRGETDAQPLFSKEDAADVVDDERLSETDREAVEKFVEKTDFDRAKLLQVQVRVPNLCYELEVDSVETDADGLTAHVSAVDTSGPDEMCAQMIAVRTVLVRAVFESEVPKSGSVTITDAQGGTHGIGYSVGHDEASADAESDGTDH
ncbi:hypothetical protein ACFOZ7_00550 [Natribaculum luteum]|uniref:Uncharacterized protein n=1 Tax=Natribaculum luteum TaxID=1586232 RepID=A0ABD5NTW2_9EURY|nr:hypothetical protein [Natribaculum luteum]